MRRTVSDSLIVRGSISEVIYPMETETDNYLCDEAGVQDTGGTYPVVTNMHLNGAEVLHGQGTCKRRNR